MDVFEPYSEREGLEKALSERYSLILFDPIS